MARLAIEGVPDNAKGMQERASMKEMVAPGPYPSIGYFPV
jgi:hypothetical protein